MAAQLKPAELNKLPVARRREEIRPAPVVLIVEDDPAIRQFLVIALRGSISMSIQPPTAVKRWMSTGVAGSTWC
jgi:hypothetical protein